MTWVDRYAAVLFIGVPVALFFFVLWLVHVRPAGPAARQRAILAADARRYDAIAAALDELEARGVVFAGGNAPECELVLREARRWQGGAMVFVKGDHCTLVRGLPRRRR